MKNLRLFWIVLQGVFLPLVWYSSKHEGTFAGWIILGLYEVLVFADAILTCRIFEPKDKAILDKGVQIGNH